MNDIEPAPLPTDSELSRISTLAERYRREERAVIRLTAELQRALKALDDTASIDLPEAMRAAGVGSFELTDGTKVSVRNTYSAGKLSDPIGLDWVEKNGGASLIKTTVTLEMDRGDLDKAREVYEGLRQHPYANRFKVLTLEEHVHQSSIAAWAREMVEAGADPPLEKLRVRQVTFAMVGDKRPKKVELKGLRDDKFLTEKGE
jgi:hypothetical protein